MQFHAKMLRATALIASAFLAAALGCTGASADELRRPAKFLDEVRIGVSGSIQRSNTFEKGVFPSFTLLFDPFDHASAATWTDKLLKPRVHAGAIVSTEGEASQVFGGFTWTVDVTDRIFIDAGFGGAWNNANASADGRGPHVGCHFLFHESLGAGYRFSENVSIMATVEHSSNANLCDSNDGLSYAGLALGYKF